MRAESIAWLGSQRQAMIDALGALVEVSSYSRDKRGADAMGDALAEHVPLVGERVASEVFGDHRVFHARRAPGGAGIVLVGHLDTVFPSERFSGWRVEGELGRGPGALDMKGGLVVIAFALQALAREGLLSDMPLSLVVVSDEELGSPEGAGVVREVARGAGAALVFEAGRVGDAIVTRRKGTGSLRVRAHGRAAHAGNAHRDGASAIRAMARFVDAAESLTDYDLGVTLNVGRIEGGIGKNTVPERCECEVDLRFVRAGDGARLRERLAALAEEVALPGTRIEVVDGPGRAPMVRTAQSAALCAEYAECQRDAGLGGGECALQGGGSDASTTSAEGIPSIDGLGPRGAGMHTLDEQVELASLAPKAEALARFLSRRRDLLLRA